MITLKGKGFIATRRPKEKLEMMYVLAQSDTEAEALILWPPDTKN